MTPDAVPSSPAPLDALRGRCVVVLGATGTVGGELLALLRASAARIAVPTHKQRHVKELQATLGDVPQLVALVGSHDSEAAAGFVKGVEDALGPIDGLVSAAGAFAVGRIGDDPAEQATTLFDANFHAVHTMTRAVVPSMLRRQTGGLVFTGAATVGRPQPGMGLYAAAKAALHEYARVLAAELGPQGLHVRVIAPGVIDTPANRAAMPEADRSGWHAPRDVARALLQQIATPDDALLQRLP